ncbi:hypothetical protein C2869_04960 [Saccharobesus litoralis]|uniref:Uncharacterized protein n=1 Tax=Saccharobesus litoralis TaxID=2172099 RepID=A0A2S0VNQ9_9ALTE|nr:hypothetical protein [Saccharobesus litoralis]AWB65829.1 hypothetical protein C2869_04960 [Saccharobesus litoralis]
MSEPQLATEYAPEYSKSEKRLRLSIYLGIALVLILVLKFGLLPFLQSFIESAHCHQSFGVSDIKILWLGLFVGIPMLTSLTLAICFWPLAIKGLVEQQYPPTGVKVFKPTKVLKGSQAKRRCALLLCLPLLFLPITIWGHTQADKAIDWHQSELDTAECVKRN